MHSLKNTFIAVLLLGASYGVYQAITTPDTSIQSDMALLDSAQLDEGGFSQTPEFGSASRNGQQPAKLPDFQDRFDGIPKLPTHVPDHGNAQANTTPDNNSFSPINPKIEPRGTRWESTAPIQQTGGASAGLTTSQIGLANQFEPSGKQPEDQALITALKNQLEQPNSSSFQPSPRKMVPGQPSMQPNAGGSPVGSTTQNSVPEEFAFIENGRNLTTQDLENAWPVIYQLVDSGQYRKALGALSRFHHAKAITGPQRQKLMGWLNALAGKVIYSAEHNIFKTPYIVRPNEQLDDISKRWGVSSQLIYNINKQAIPDPNDLVSGTELKVINGPINGQIDLTNMTLTLFVRSLYASQFRIYCSDPNSLRTGVFTVSDMTSSTSADLSGQPQLQIVLDGQITLSTTGENPPRGSIGLSQKDGGDLFTILTQKSRIVIER